MSSWGNRIKVGLQKPGLSQAGLARACKVSGPTVSEWVNDGIQMLAGDNLVAAAKYLRCSAEWIMTGHGAGPQSQSVGLDPERLASSVTLGRLAHDLLDIEFDAETDADTVALAYEWMQARDQRAATADNVVEFSKFMKRQAQGR
jgi:transcriptional regulator with XRE-family HTH domain